MVKLWAYETMRVFMDRLINEKDQLIFKNILKQIIKNNFKYDLDKIVKSKPLLFGDFIPTVDKNL